MIMEAFSAWIPGTRVLAWRLPLTRGGAGSRGAGTGVKRVRRSDAPVSHADPGEASCE